MTTAIIGQRLQFFDFIFRNQEGIVCIATQDPLKGRDSFKQSFFRYPQGRTEMADYITFMAIRHNVWFGVNLLSIGERRKENCLPTNLVWADLDEAHPDEIDPKPPIVIESSPGRFQGIWMLDQIVDPTVAEDYSRRIAYLNTDKGADVSGWDLTQLLRVPDTFNYKYEVPPKVPKVKLVRMLDVKAPVALFEKLPQGEHTPESILDREMPAEELDVQKVLYKYWLHLKRTPFNTLYEYEPEPTDDWSKLLWRLINVCFEVGMSAEEVYAICLASKINKYERDKRPLRFLWRDICKAEAMHQRVISTTGELLLLEMPQLVDKPGPKTFIDDYRKWGEMATDAVAEYHELSAFIALSSLLSGNLKLNTSYGAMIPNLWGLILGDSTLTRKTTAMRMVTDLITEIDDELIVATDGSAEGLITALSTRPGRTSMYFKDEVAGFIESIVKKDYLAGMPETLTQLYDVPKIFTRRLRSEIITVSNPIFIFFGGGIREKFYSQVNEQFVLSGFLPRFLIVAGETDMTQIRRTGPANQIGDLQRNTLKAALEKLYATYKQESVIHIGGGAAFVPKITEVFLSTDAWTRYGDIEMAMAGAAAASPYAMTALPSFERLSRSILKMSMLIAATRKEPESDTLIVDDTDVDIAAWYGQKWGVHTIDMLRNVGKTSVEKDFERVLQYIRATPGVLKSEVMRRFHLTKRNADDIIGTLEERSQITTKREGRGISLWP